MSTPILIFVFKLLVSFTGLTLIYLLLIRYRAVDIDRRIGGDRPEIVPAREPAHIRYRHFFR